jgi:hypothetical protein
LLRQGRIVDDTARVTVATGPLFATCRIEMPFGTRFRPIPALKREKSRRVGQIAPSLRARWQKVDYRLKGTDP